MPPLDPPSPLQASPTLSGASTPPQDPHHQNNDDLARKEPDGICAGHRLAKGDRACKAVVCGCGNSRIISPYHFSRASRHTRKQPPHKLVVPSLTHIRHGFPSGSFLTRSSLFWARGEHEKDNLGVTYSFLASRMRKGERQGEVEHLLKSPNCIKIPFWVKINTIVTKN